MANWDYIIVGGGSAGCVLANRLSENPTHRVLLLDAGVEDWSPIIHVPALMIFHEWYNWSYEALPDPSRHGMIDRWSAGSALGGGSSINGMMFVRGNRADFDRWAQLGCVGWDYNSVLKSFRDTESFEGGADAYRGGEGPQRVSFSRAVSPITQMFIDAARNCGFPYNADYNGSTQDGVALVQQSQWRGRRWSTAKAFLTPVRHRRNLEVRTRCPVNRIIIEDGRAVGVNYTRRGEEQTDRCNGEVIVCAGAIGSPKLLMLSGIGPAAHLREHGIHVEVDSPSVGSNLMEHPAVWATADVNVPTFNAENRLHRHLVNGIKWLLWGTGPASAGIAQAQVFSHTRAELVAPNMQIVFTPVNWAMDHEKKSLRLSRQNAISIAAVVLQPRARGRLSLASSDPAATPIIDHQLLGDADDALQLVEGVRQIVRLLRTAPLSTIVDKITLPRNPDGSDADLLKELRSVAFRGDHPSGTCRMGSDAEAVVDPCLRVRGVRCLRVADASIIPVITNGNTNAPTIMIGQKASELILSEKSASSSNGESQQ